MKTAIKFFQRKSISFITRVDIELTKTNRKSLSTLSKGSRLNMYMSKFFRKFILILESQPGILDRELGLACLGNGGRDNNYQVSLYPDG